MKKNNRWLIEVLSLVLLLQSSGAEAATRDSTGRRYIPVAGTDIRPALSMSGNETFRCATLSAHLKYGFRFRPDSPSGLFAPYSVQGVGVAFNTFGNSKVIGNPLALYVFQTSRLAAVTDKLSLDYEWNFGVSPGWKKYGEDNPDNTIVGSNVNAYINLGVLLNFQLNDQLHLRAGVSLTHFSNGNTSYPNAGVNTAGCNLGIAYDFGDAASGMALARKGVEARQAEPLRHRISCDLVLYGATRKKGFHLDDGSPVLVPGSFAVAGLNVSPLFSVSKYFKAGLSLDAQYDESANIAGHIANTDSPDSDNIKFHRPPFGEQFAIGLSVRAELSMPIFSINLGVGRNIICRGADTDSFYQIFALKAFVTKRSFVHIGYQLYHFDTPNNLMIGLGFRFK